MNETPDTAQRPAQPVVATGPLFGQEIQTFQPTMIQRPEWDWLNLQDIATECQRLCDAVTVRMSSDQPTDKQVWEMMKAHRAAVDALTRRPNKQVSNAPQSVPPTL